MRQHPIQLSAASARWHLWAAGIISLAVFLRLLYSVLVDLIPEETYYWQYSRHLDIGYLDHPPMVAWLIRGGTLVFGHTEFGVRLGALCCGLTASFFVFRLTRNLFGDYAAWISLAMAQALPFFFLSGMLATPDAPLTAAWAASLFFLERALIAGQSRAWAWLGLAVGVGLLSKYTIGLLGVAGAFFMVLDPSSRRWFRRWEPYAAILIAAAVIAPVLLWNAQHDWASFAFQTSRRLAEPPRFSLHKLIAAGMILITPTGLAAVAVALAVRPTSSPRAWRLLTIAVAVPLSVFALFSLRHEVKLDWTGAPWVAALPIMACGIAQGRAPGRLRSSIRAAWPWTLATLLILYSVGLDYLVFGIPGLGYSRHTELLPVAWREFGRQIDGIAEAVRGRYGADPLVVGMDRYAIASERAFYSRDPDSAVAQTCSWHLFGNQGLMYERWFPIGQQTGRTLLLVAFDANDLSEAQLAAHVSSLEAVQQGALTRNGSTVRPYFYRVAHGYKPEP